MLSTIYDTIQKTSILICFANDPASLGNFMIVSISTIFISNFLKRSSLLSCSVQGILSIGQQDNIYLNLHLILFPANLLLLVLLCAVFLQYVVLHNLISLVALSKIHTVAWSHPAIQPSIQISASGTFACPFL